jgi:L-threonylcarbamoyladenylate synthase
VTLIEPGRIAAFPWADDRRIGLIVAGHTVPAGVGRPSVRVDWADPSQAARELYETLHRWDDGTLDGILVVLPPDDDAWRAVRDRLWRASRRWARG